MDPKILGTKTLDSDQKKQLQYTSMNIKSAFMDLRT